VPSGFRWAALFQGHFFKHAKEMEWKDDSEGLTFDDVLLLPGKSSVFPRKSTRRRTLRRKFR